MKILYVHGLGRQPEPPALKFLYDKHLFGESRKDSLLVLYSDILFPPEEDSIKGFMKAVDPPEPRKGEFYNQVYSYYTEDKRREAIQARLIQALDTDNRFIVIAHSAGAVIAYDVLSKFDTQIEVPLFMTLGAPISHPYIYEQISDGLLPGKPWPVLKWKNFIDPQDLLASPVEGKFQGKGVKDCYVMTGGHGAINYLSCQEVQEEAILATLPLYKFMY